MVLILVRRVALVSKEWRCQGSSAPTRCGKRSLVKYLGDFYWERADEWWLLDMLSACYFGSKAQVETRRKVEDLIRNMAQVTISGILEKIQSRDKVTIILTSSQLPRDT